MAGVNGVDARPPCWCLDPGSARGASLRPARPRGWRKRGERARAGRLELEKDRNPGCGRAKAETVRKDGMPRRGRANAGRTR